LLTTRHLSQFLQGFFSRCFTKSCKSSKVWSLRTFSYCSSCSSWLFGCVRSR